MCIISILFFFFNDTATTEIYTLSLHDALPICAKPEQFQEARAFVDSIPVPTIVVPGNHDVPLYRIWERALDRKSTRLNSSHSQISYAVFCLKKKNDIDENQSSSVDLLNVTYI